MSKHGTLMNGVYDNHETQDREYWACGHVAIAVTRCLIDEHKGQPGLVVWGVFPDVPDHIKDYGGNDENED